MLTALESPGDAGSARQRLDAGVRDAAPVISAYRLDPLRQISVEGMYRLGLQADGRAIEWISTDASGQRSTTTDEPEGDHWLRLKLWLQSLIVDERLL